MGGRELPLEGRERGDKSGRRASREGGSPLRSYQEPRRPSYGAKLLHPSRQRKVRSVLSPCCVGAAARRAVLSPLRYLFRPPIACLFFLPARSTHLPPIGSLRLGCFPWGSESESGLGVPAGVFFSVPNFHHQHI